MVYRYEVKGIPEQIRIKEKIIGKMVIFSFSDAEEHIIDRLKSVIEEENYIEYVEITPKLVLSFPNIEICLKEHKVYRSGKRIPLSNQEFLGLQFLAEHPEWVCTKEEIYDAVYGEKNVGDVDNIIYCLICSLRKKLEEDPRHPKYIQTVRGAGYKFVVPGE